VILQLGYRYSRALMMLSVGDLVLDITIVTEGQLRADDDNPASITMGAAARRPTSAPGRPRSANRPG